MNLIELFSNNWFQTLTVLAALYFGWQQTAINKRLKDLQDYVAVSLVISNQKLPEQLAPFQPAFPFFKFINVGKINIYIYRLQIPEADIDEKYQLGRLIPAGTTDPSYHFPVPTHIKGNFTIILSLKDEFNTKYISKHGGDINEKIVRVWSYKIYKKNDLFNNLNVFKKL